MEKTGHARALKYLELPHHHIHGFFQLHSRSKICKVRFFEQSNLITNHMPLEIFCSFLSWWGNKPKEEPFLHLQAKFFYNSQIFCCHPNPLEPGSKFGLLHQGMALQLNLLVTNIQSRESRTFLCHGEYLHTNCGWNEMSIILYISYAILQHWVYFGWIFLDDERLV